MTEPHPIETLWRELGLPEWFLGNGESNTKLYALYERIAKPAPIIFAAWQWLPIDHRPLQSGRYLVGHRGHQEIMTFFGPDKEWVKGTKLGWHRFTDKGWGIDDPAERFKATHCVLIQTPDQCAETQALAEAGAWPVGEFFHKTGGDIQYSGKVLAAYRTSRGKLRYVGEIVPQGFQYIINPEHVEIEPAMTAAKAEELSRRAT